MKADSPSPRHTGRLHGIGNALRLFAIQLALIAILVTLTLAMQPATASAYTGAGTETTSAPMGDPEDCWMAPVPCIIFSAE